jgi:hypothetical protein
MQQVNKVKRACVEFLLRLVSKNKVLKPYRMLFNLSRGSSIHNNNLIPLFAGYYNEVYIRQD